MLNSYPKIDLKNRDPRKMLAQFSIAARRGLTVRAIVRDVSSSLDPIAKKAASILATRIDRDPLCRVPAYHNVAHYLDTAVTALTLAHWEAQNPSTLLNNWGLQLIKEDVADCFIAGLIHDLGHPGGNNNGVPFKLEKESWALAAPLLRQAGYSDQRLQRLETLILATDPSHGVPMVERAMRIHTRTKEEEVDFVAPLTELNDPQTAAMAYIVTKADIAFSLMQETSFNRTKAMHREFEERGTGNALFRTDGQLDTEKMGDFYRLIAHIDERPMHLESIEDILGKSARETMASMLRPRAAQATILNEHLIAR